MRKDITFQSKGVTCRGWLTFPAQGAAPRVPLIVMGHGFGATRNMHLEQYAERFNAVGMATLIFDYRHFGDSDGEPRNMLDPRREIEDFHAALATARSLDGVDTNRIALWGTSFGGGLVVSVAAEDGHVAATVSQCPMLDGRASSRELLRYAGLGSLLRLSAHGALDLARAALGLSPHYIPIVAEPGGVGAMSSHDAWTMYGKLAPGGFRNEVTASSTLRVPLFRPIDDASKVTCPALFVICDNDSVAPPAVAEAAAKRIPKAEIVRFPVGHFDVYFDEDFERSVAAQVAFLVKHLSVRSRLGRELAD